MTWQRKNNSVITTYDYSLTRDTFLSHFMIQWIILAIVLDENFIIYVNLKKWRFAGKVIYNCSKKCLLLLSGNLNATFNNSKLLILVIFHIFKKDLIFVLFEWIKRMNSIGSDEVSANCQHTVIMKLLFQKSVVTVTCDRILL